MQSWLWLPLALLSALFAALVAIFGKMGLTGINTVAATTARSAIMFLILLAASAATGTFSQATALRGKPLLYVALAGAAGAASWLCYFWALKVGRAGQVAAVDRFSVVITIGLAAIILGEHTSLKTVIGAAFITIGAVLVALG